MRKSILIPLKLIILIIIFLAFTTAVNAQTMIINPNEFDEKVTEFSVELQSLNPNIEYEFRILCRGKDYVWKFTPNKLSSDYFIGGNSTGIKFVVNKKDAACGFELDEPLIEQSFQTTLSWLQDGETKASYIIKPSYNCQVSINPATFDLATNPEGVTISISGLPQPGSRSWGTYGVWLVKKNLTTGDITDYYYILGSMVVDKNGQINIKYSDFPKRPTNPGIYTIHLQYGDKGMACQAHFNLETYIPPGTTPSPPPVAPTTGPISQPLDLSVSRICDSIQDSNLKSTCEVCADNNGVWTALGCIKTNASGLVDSFFKIGLGVFGGIALLLLFYGFFMVLTSGGNAEQIQLGKQIVTAAITGLLLIIFSLFLLQFTAIDVLKLPGFERNINPTIPAQAPTPTPASCNTGICRNDCICRGDDPAICNLLCSAPTPIPTPTIPPDSSLGLTINFTDSNPADSLPAFDPKQNIKVAINNLSSYSWNTLLIAIDKNNIITACEQFSGPQISAVITTPNTPASPAFISAVATYFDCSTIPKQRNQWNNLVTTQATRPIVIR